MDAGRLLGLPNDGGGPGWLVEVFCRANHQLHLVAPHLYSNSPSHLTDLWPSATSHQS